MSKDDIDGQCHHLFNFSWPSRHDGFKYSCNREPSYIRFDLVGVLRKVAICDNCQYSTCQFLSATIIIEMLFCLELSVRGRLVVFYCLLI